MTPDMGEPPISDADDNLADQPSPQSLAPQPSMESQPAHDDWGLRPEFEGLRDRDVRSGAPPRRLGVTWKNLTVRAVSADAAIHENVLSQFNIPRRVAERRHKPPLKTILDRSHGCVKPGEMLLVLGRPGSGCTTLLSILANRRRGYESVEGDVHYGSMDAAMANMYRGQIVINTEEELFFPSLTVGQTVDFSTRMKVPKALPEGVSTPREYQEHSRDLLLRSMGIDHTLQTKVGNEYVRGVSGGERKRVSLVETLATRASVFCWDNATRGLDASTALEYAKVIRATTDVFGLASIVTLYQAGNGIYNLFDKVLVLDGGKQMYYGPAKEARPFMEQLGFVCRDGANVADFLTGVTVPTERAVRPGLEKSFPRNATMLQAEYEKAPVYARMIGEYDYPFTPEARDNTEQFRRAVARERDGGLLPADSPLTVSFATQVRACVIRQFQITWGDKPSLVIKQGSTILLALITGSLFYKAPNNSSGLFLKGGVLFFSLLYNSLLAMSEVTDSFTGRPVLAKHKSFAYYHPAAFCMAQIIGDIPLMLVQISNFSLIVYFMAGLTSTASGFFTFWTVMLAVSMCMTACFRAIGAAFSTFDGASKVSGLLFSVFVTYSGYMIQKPNMHPWFVWLAWIDPIFYGLDSLLSSELKGKTIPCVGPNLIPHGPSYNDTTHQSCTGVPGASPGDTVLTGDQYLGALSFGRSHIWRNLGIIWAWWALFVFITIIATSRWRASSEGGTTLLIPRERSKGLSLHQRPRLPQPSGDIEAQAEEFAINEKTTETGEGSSDKKADTDGMPDAMSGDGKTDMVGSKSVFTWKNLTYTVKTPSGDRVLLNKVQGYVKPGMLGALMGSSGAGKTTLLDVLAQRKTEGTIEGSVLVDGRPLPVSFQRSAGYCEQLDVHEPYATVREALEFSALLRQSRETSREEKLQYVDVIIDLLELHDLADTLIGKVGNGLTVEQRKRVTIGVELVAKPSILIFLDEPTSGLDGQSAFDITRFLRKLADAGQAVLVTIHQPSAQLFAQFDTLLLLAQAGKTVYFGDIGDNAQTVRDYFARHGAPCPVEANPAEHMIDVVSGHAGQGRDWNKLWLESPEHAAVSAEIDRIVSEAAAKPPATVDDGHEFAAPMMAQMRIVTERMNLSLYRNTDYVMNKFALHIFSALFNGFSFWMIGSSVADLQSMLFTIFQFIFVAPGVLAQLQPLFIDRRNIFEAREKKSKMYSWVSFGSGLIVSEFPYLIICAVLYFVCWYYTVGFPSDSTRAGATFFVMMLYEFLYTGIGQFVAAYAPNAMFAALTNPILLSILVFFCGVLVPYSQITAFWRYWLYYLNPFNYLMGALLVFDVWGSDVTCAPQELARFDPPHNATTTCRAYLADYLAADGSGARLLNPDARSNCQVCPYRSGSDYLATLNLNSYSDGWRDVGIVAGFVFSSYGLVFLLMKLRTKTSKKAE